MEIKESETESPPETLNEKSVVYWSSHYKKLVVEGGDTAIGFKARRFIENNCIEYYKDGFDSSKNCYLCKPIPGYNKTTYKLVWNKDLGDFECDCQYYQTKLLKKEEAYCSHYLGLYLQLKIWNYNRKGEKNADRSTETSKEKLL